MSRDKHVLITYDVPGWCWHRRAIALQKYAPKNVQVTVQRGTPKLARNTQALKSYDAILWQEWWSAPTCAYALVANEGALYPYPHVKDSWYLPRKTASKAKNLAVAERLLPKVRGIICVNPNLIQDCRAFNSNTYSCFPGIDPELWLQSTRIPILKPREGEKYRIGWCGKPSTPNKWSPKGYQEVLIPLMAHLRDQAPHIASRIEWSTITRDSTNAFSQEDMDRWYRTLDLFLCTSCSEGTPNTVLEAMACYVPVISTRVGLISFLRHANREKIEDPEDEISRYGICEVPNWTSKEECSTTIDHMFRSIAFYIGMKSEDLHCDSIDKSSPKWEALHLDPKAAYVTVTEDFNWNILAPIWFEALLDENFTSSNI